LAPGRRGGRLKPVMDGAPAPPLDWRNPCPAGRPHADCPHPLRSRSSTPPVSDPGGPVNVLVRRPETIAYADPTPAPPRRTMVSPGAAGGSRGAGHRLAASLGDPDLVVAGTMVSSPSTDGGLVAPATGGHPDVMIWSPQKRRDGGSVIDRWMGRRSRLHSSGLTRSLTTRPLATLQAACRQTRQRQTRWRQCGLDRASGTSHDQ
jgi:hypothetical protein